MPDPAPIPPAIAQAMGQATALHRAGRLAEAIALYRRVTAAAPLFPEAHNNLAAALNAAGDRAGAAQAWRRAVALRPDYAAARANLGALLAAMGQAAEGLEQLATAQRLAPSDATIRDRLLAALPPDPPPPGPELAAALDRLAADPGTDLDRLAAPGAALLAAAPPVAALRADPDGPLPEDLRAALGTPLARALLADAVLPDARVEAALTTLRRRWLAEPPADRALLASVALQAMATEWAWDETPEEAAAAEALGPADPLLRALYRPLEGPADAALPEGPEATLLRRALAEPAEEAALAAALPALTPVTDPVSLGVRAQYDANAYPRWRRLPRREARPLARVLARVLPAAPARVAEAPRILVAGCGTGRHALLTATRYAGAEVLAVDLSRAALGFAARQAREHGVGNIAFAAADILGLGALDRRFDLIECSGTLHHMADPEAGWRVLRGLLAPGGLMRIALYSARARTGVTAARADIAHLGLPPTPEGIRAARRHLRTRSEDPTIAPLLETADFYSLSGCRDLLFHIHEDRFDLPRIARALDALSLRFLGFELPSPSLREAFRRRFPAARAETDLAAWDAFEAEHPLAFAAMYQFWCEAD